jgi:TolA-binding protein
MRKIMILLIITIFLFFESQLNAISEDAKTSNQNVCRAYKLTESGRNEEAQNLLKEFIKNYPDSPENPEARLQLAILLANTDEAKSKNEFQNLIENHYESSQALKALYHLGYIHFKSGEIDDASVCYSLLISRAPNPLPSAGSVAFK